MKFNIHCGTKEKGTTMHKRRGNIMKTMTVARLIFSNPIKKQRKTQPTLCLRRTLSVGSS
jgi:hypothetical protein